MDWYPGKYAGKAAAATKRAAKEAVEVAKTAINEGPAAAKKRAEQDLAVARAEAERAWTEAKDEALEALGRTGQLHEFEDKARSIAKHHEKLIVLARDTAVEISLDAYDVIAKKILTPGEMTTETQALELMKQVYGPSKSVLKLQSATEEASKREGLRTLSVCNNAAAGLVVGLEVAGFGPPILRHDFNRWLPVPYHEGAVVFGGIVSVSAGVSVGVFKGAANEQAGNFIKITWALDVEGPGAHVSVSFSLQDGEFDGFDVGLEVAVGSPINIYGSVGRTMLLPPLFLI